MEVIKLSQIAEIISKTGTQQSSALSKTVLCAKVSKNSSYLGDGGGY